MATAAATEEDTTRLCDLPEACVAFRGGKGTDGVDVRGPALRGDGWWEIEMGRLRTGNEAVAGEEVAVSFEMLGWYHKRGLVVEGVEFRPL
ncbi:hypothetical protein TRIUR3_10787 [Triticum urartu]|uniref:Uncharacterized protein n=2 Tax=Triticum TaxID=4564 RepID=A0A9R0RBL6_TRITD|nr:hypothetical protein TRIUR3_10787 [Triticum urartu]VAH57003.1 unnamed protein product [Triticum turgidum subsp. durum]